jgi:hypothetical protein
MKLVEINWNPSERQLRQFGIICLFALPLVGWFWGGGPVIVGWLGVIGLAFAFAGVVLPKTLKPCFLALTFVAAPIGVVSGELAMLLIYVAVFLPIGIVFRCVGRDALRLKADRQATTYWQVKNQSGSVASYYRQS